MNGLAIAVVMLGLATILIGARDLRRRSFDRHVRSALRLGAQDRHPSSRHR